MAQFSRYKVTDAEHNIVVKICRWFGCENSPKHPYREFCSRECSDKFEHWYWQMFFKHFSWEQCKRDVWERDAGKCKLCGTSCDGQSPCNANSPEYDHVIPETIAQHRLGYDPNTFRYLHEILFNRYNVRLLCHPCHRRVTARMMSKLFAKKTIDRRDLEINEMRVHTGMRALFSDPREALPIGQRTLDVFCEQ